MSNNASRYSKLAPFPPAERFRLAKLAVNFFSVLRNEEMCAAVGKERSPNQHRHLSAQDFLAYLAKSNLLPEADRYLHKLEELLVNLADAGILKVMGHTGSAYLGTCYMFMREQTILEGQGWMWLAPVLGAEFIRDQFSAVTVQLAGVDRDGAVRAGTGLEIAPNWLLTCGHVVREMKLSETLQTKGGDLTVRRVMAHPAVDVGLVEVSPALPSLPGLALRDPRMAEDVFTLGFPRIPLSREPALVMHKGDVTCDSVVFFSGQELFLFSATARPGNSGGPIIAATGHVVGIVSEQLADGGSESALPFFAGVRTSQIVRAVRELEPSVGLPVEDYA